MLTTDQLATLRAAILAEPAVAQFLADGRHNAIKDFYNAYADPAVKAWRPYYDANDLFSATKLTEYIARTAGERQAYDMLLSRGALDATRKAIRDAVADIFSGQSNSTSRAAILNDMTENATRAHVLFGGSSVTTDTVTALKRNYTDLLTDHDIYEALR